MSKLEKIIAVVASLVIILGLGFIFYTRSNGILIPQFSGTNEIEQISEQENELVTEIAPLEEAVKEVPAIEGGGVIDVIKHENGTSEIFHRLENLTLTQTTGPFKVDVVGVNVARIDFNQEFTDLFGDNPTLIGIDFRIENTTDDTVSIHPDQSKLVTDTQEQVNSMLFLSDSVGGEYYGRVIKEGTVYFHLKSNAPDITNLRLILDGPYDVNFNSIGEQIEFAIDLN